MIVSFVINLNGHYVVMAHRRKTIENKPVLILLVLKRVQILGVLNIIISFDHHYKRMKFLKSYKIDLMVYF